MDIILKDEDTLLISTIQLGITSILGVIAMMFFETPSLPHNYVQWGAIIGLGLVCSAYGFVIQPMTQKYISPSKVGLIFSLEPVFSALLSYIFLKEILSIKEYTGATLIFLGVLVSSIKLRSSIKNKVIV